jgi:hypothetical protein
VDLSMQNSNETNVKYFQLNKYQIAYPANMDAKTFDEEWYYGIIFTIEDKRYELIHNYQMDAERIFISHRGRVPSLPDHYLLGQDIPFKPVTFNFLPEGVTAKEV